MLQRIDHAILSTTACTLRNTKPFKRTPYLLFIISLFRRRPCFSPIPSRDSVSRSPKSRASCASAAQPSHGRRKPRGARPTARRPGGPAEPREAGTSSCVRPGMKLGCRELAFLEPELFLRDGAETVRAGDFFQFSFFCSDHRLLPAMSALPLDACARGRATHPGRRRTKPRAPCRCADT